MSHDYDRWGDDNDRKLRHEGLGVGWGRDSGGPPFEMIGPDDDEQWVDADGNVIPETADRRG